VAQNSETSLEEVQNDQNRRDRQDTSRAESPLQVARGSIVVDTTGMTLEEVVDRLYEDVAGLLPTVLDSPHEKP
jgi:cytidylate kinase